MNAAVICGAFNPVTKAHIHMGLLVKETLHVDKVIYVPAAESFLKSWKQYEKDDIFSNEERLKFLQSAITPYEYMEVNDIEIKSGELKTYQLLCKIKEQYRYNEIYFVVGTDKIPELKTWYRSMDLLKEFHLVVISRNEDPYKTILENPFVWIFRKNIICISNKQEDSVFSSTQLRIAIREKDKVTIEKIFPDECIKLLTKGKG